MKKILIYLFLFPITLMAQKLKPIKQDIQLGDSIVTIVAELKALQSQIIFMNIHEDEQTSIEAIKIFGKTTPLNFVYLQHLQTRRVYFNIGRRKYSVDPNRIYTELGRKNTLKTWNWFGFKAKKSAVEETEKLANAILAYVSIEQVIVTMHNNTDVNYSIKSYLPGESESENTAEVNVNENWDADDFIYTTEKKYYDYLKAKGLNVILQNNSDFVNDGSLSVYCGIKEIPYLNIEAQKGHLKEQIELTKIVYDMLVSFSHA